MNYIFDLLLNILTSGLPCCLLALGIFLTYRLLDFADLTAEGSFLMGGAVCLTLIVKGVDPFTSTIIAFIVGAICGIITGLLNTCLNIPKLLSGIITMTATASIALLIMGFTSSKSPFTNLVTLSNKDNTIYSIFYGGVIPNQVVESIVMLIVVVLFNSLVYFFFGTVFHDRYLKFIGYNATAYRNFCSS